MEGFCHVDDLDIMSCEKGLFSANMYLKMPPVGGELRIWDIQIDSRWNFYRHAYTLSQLLGQDEEGQAHLR